MVRSGTWHLTRSLLMRWDWDQLASLTVMYFIGFDRCELHCTRTDRTARLIWIEPNSFERSGAFRASALADGGLMTVTVVLDKKARLATELQVQFVGVPSGDIDPETLNGDLRYAIEEIYLSRIREPYNRMMACGLHCNERSGR